VAEHLVGVALKRYTSDNVACVVLDFKDNGARAAAAAAASSESGTGGGNWLKGLFGKNK